MAEEVVAITGGSGFLAQHLISYLQRTSSQRKECVVEIRTIDRNPFSKFLDYPVCIPLKHYQFDICNENALKKALHSVTTVFHCAGKSLEYLHDGTNHTDQYWYDNTNATEILLNVMCEEKIPRLIHVSDAYANLPVGDNYGLSEQMHLGLPDSFMLGMYGQSKIRAEMCVRKAAAKGQINALILRPTFIYGEGEKHLLGSALKLCSVYGGIPYLQDESRGHHQFLYAGNMAAIMKRGMVCLKENPERYNGEVVICMDRTQCIRFVDFMEPFLLANGLKRISTLNYFQTHFIAIFYEILNRFAPEKSFGHLTLLANKFINCWTVGFSNRKLRLLLDFVPPYEQSQALDQSLYWHRKNGQGSESRNRAAKMA
uniref:3Beta_HSD domain-containing protein n=1 Tax=Elaeophora elaphi TaxID=1147741 RepID=A0A0R3RXV0_9BILA